MEQFEKLGAGAGGEGGCGMRDYICVDAAAVARGKLEPDGETVGERWWCGVGNGGEAGGGGEAGEERG